MLPIRAHLSEHSGPHSSFSSSAPFSGDYMSFASFTHSFSLDAGSSDNSATGNNSGSTSSTSSSIRKMTACDMDDLIVSAGADLAEDSIDTMVPQSLSHAARHGQQSTTSMFDDVQFADILASCHDVASSPCGNTALPASVARPTPSTSSSSICRHSAHPVPPATPSFSDALLAAGAASTCTACSGSCCDSHSAISVACGMPSAHGCTSPDHCSSPRVVPHFRGFSAIYQQEPSASSSSSSSTSTSNTISLGNHYRMPSPISCSPTTPPSGVSMHPIITLPNVATADTTGIFLSDPDTCLDIATDILAHEEREASLVVPQLSTTASSASSCNTSPTTCVTPTTPLSVSFDSGCNGTASSATCTSASGVASAMSPVSFRDIFQSSGAAASASMHEHLQLQQHLQRQQHQLHQQLQQQQSLDAASTVLFPDTSSVSDMGLKIEVIEDTTGSTISGMDDYSRWLFPQGQYGVCDDTLSCEGSEADSWASAAFYGAGGTASSSGASSRPKKTTSPPRVRKHVGDMTPQELEKARKQGRLAARRNRAIRKARWEQQVQDSDELKRRNYHLQAIIEKLRPQIIRMRQQVIMKFQQDAKCW